MFYILYVLWYTGEEPAIYGLFKSEESAMTFFSLERSRKKREPENAIIYEQSCPGRKSLVGTLRFVKGGWR